MIAMGKIRITLPSRPFNRERCSAAKEQHLKKKKTLKSTTMKRMKAWLFDKCINPYFKRKCKERKVIRYLLQWQFDWCCFYAPISNHTLLLNSSLNLRLEYWFTEYFFFFTHFYLNNSLLQSGFSLRWKDGWTDGERGGRGNEVSHLWQQELHLYLWQQ